MCLREDRAASPRGRCISAGAVQCPVEPRLVQTGRSRGMVYRGAGIAVAPEGFEHPTGVEAARPCASDPMTSPLRFALLSVASAAVAFFVQPAFAQDEGRAVARCRAVMLRQFPEGAIQSHRVASIQGNSRRIRVHLIVNADRRYTFDCVADGDGAVQTAVMTPPANTSVAGQPVPRGQ
jgi:hypothetical protein